ncbi:hypothetical protein [Paraflavitalea sp. CAU 1676]|uniref:hypothetical protein n=1 Tax=Paraflavitalea sp. CAU 1676 TaxID=3032598 RepID=UPI0023DC1249|nr:hypothetical protein [Paraflavitalea sp. CAU 1676]MDF2192739.1 hypothetical protein [Paraflavitalea sp. CAU 1676]
MVKLLPIIFWLLACQRSLGPDVPAGPVIPDTVAAGGFEKSPEVISIKNGMVPEASGIADSKRNAGYLWVEQDRGNPTYIYLLKHDGTLTDSIFIEGSTNQDWEDIFLAGDQLYIGDIGDNLAAYGEYRFYQMTEPALGTKKVSIFKTISFKYADGAHDAEAFLVDPATKDIFVITKQGDNSKIYKIAYPQSYTGWNEAVLIGSLPYTGVVSATLSIDAKEIILKTYNKLYYYTKEPTQSIPAGLSKAPATLDYKLELQGEAVTFRVDNKGFYTLSERLMGVVPSLNYYRRK